MGERGAVHTYRATFTRRLKSGERVTKTTSGWAWRFAYHGRRYAGGGAFKSRAEAREVGEARKREVVAGQIQDPRRTTYETLEQIILAEYSLKGEAQERNVRCSLKWLRTAFGGKLAGDITREDLINYVKARRLTPTRGRIGASDTTIKLELNLLGRAMRLAHESGRLLAVPKFPTIPVYPRASFMTQDQVRAVLAVLPSWWSAAVEVGYLTGWRFRSEVLTREWAHVDWQAGYLRLFTGEGKRRRARPYPITERLREILAEQAAHVEAMTRELGKTIPWVFPGLNGQRMKYPYGCWRTACRRAGVVGKQPHDLRRTFVRDLNLAHVPPAAGMAASGHRDERTYRGYTGSDDDLVRWAIEQVEAQRSGPQKVVSLRKPATEP